MNKISTKTLLHSKWTKVEIRKKEKHFVVSDVKLDDEQRIIQCIIQAVMTRNEYDIQWRDLTDEAKWIIGWK